MENCFIGSKFYEFQFLENAKTKKILFFLQKKVFQSNSGLFQNLYFGNIFSHNTKSDSTTKNSLNERKENFF